MEKLVLNTETFDNVSKMLKSASSEDAVVALTALENADFSKSMVYMLLLYKESTNRKSWEENCPSVVKKIKDMNFTNDVISFREIFHQVKGKVAKEDMTLFLDKFSDQLKIQLETWGFDFVKNLNLKITLPDE